MKQYTIDFQPEGKTILRLTMRKPNPKKYESATKEQAKDMFDCIERFESVLSVMKKDLLEKSQKENLVKTEHNYKYKDCDINICIMSAGPVEFHDSVIKDIINGSVLVAPVAGV